MYAVDDAYIINKQEIGDCVFYEWAKEISVKKIKKDICYGKQGKFHCGDGILNN